MRTEKAQISKIRNAKGEVTTNTMEIIRDYLRTGILINFKIFKKWTDFWILMTTQN
jgi:hypothetical protein